MSSVFDLKEYVGESLYFEPTGDLIDKCERLHKGVLVSVVDNFASIKLDGSSRAIKMQIGVKGSRNSTLKRTYVFQSETGGYYVYRNEKELHRNDHRDGKTPYQASLDQDEVALFDFVMKQRKFKTKKLVLITLLEEERERLTLAKDETKAKKK